MFCLAGHAVDIHLKEAQSHSCKAPLHSSCQKQKGVSALGLIPCFLLSQVLLYVLMDYDHILSHVNFTGQIWSFKFSVIAELQVCQTPQSSH